MREVSIDLRAADDGPFDERRLARAMIRCIRDAGQTIAGSGGNLDRAADRCPMQQTCDRAGDRDCVNDEPLHVRQLPVGENAKGVGRAECSGMTITSNSR